MDFLNSHPNSSKKHSLVGTPGADSIKCANALPIKVLGTSTIFLRRRCQRVCKCFANKGFRCRINNSAVANAVWVPTDFANKGFGYIHFNRHGIASIGIHGKTASRYAIMELSPE